MHYKQIMKAYPDAKVGPSFVNHLLTWCVFLSIGCVVRERSKDMVHLRLHIHLPNWFSSKVICLKNMNMRKCKNIMLFIVRTSLGEAPNCKVACWTGHKFQKWIKSYLKIDKTADNLLHLYSRLTEGDPLPIKWLMSWIPNLFKAANYLLKVLYKVEWRTTTVLCA